MKKAEQRNDWRLYGPTLEGVGGAERDPHAETTSPNGAAPVAPWGGRALSGSGKESRQQAAARLRENLRAIPASERSIVGVPAVGRRLYKPLLLHRARRKRYSEDIGPRWRVQPARADSGPVHDALPAAPLDRVASGKPQWDRRTEGGRPLNLLKRTAFAFRSDTPPAGGGRPSRVEINSA